MIKERLRQLREKMEERGIDIYVVPTSDLNRVLLKIKKEKATPKAYPRKAGTPAKEPIK